MQTLAIETRARCEFVDITDRVQAALTNLAEGICLVACPHTTAAITINEGYDPDVVRDVLRRLEALAPRDGDYRHAEGNSDAHIKAILVGPSVTVGVSGGRLRLGRWQRLFFCEFDSPRRREVWLHTLTAGREALE